jgi:hypothetical protein
MKLSKKITLAVLAVVGIAVSVLTIHSGGVNHHTVGFILTALTGLGGTATIIQTWPLAGTFPTSAQAVDYNTQVNRVVFGDADTTAVLTHNWMIPAAQLAAFFPLINYYIQNANSVLLTYPILTFALTDSNTVTITKDAGTGTGGTFVVTLQRPYSATQ